MGLRALINVVPLVVVLAVAGAVTLTSSPSIGFPLAGFIGAGGYVVLLSVFMWLVVSRRLELDLLRYVQAMGDPDVRPTD
jgi:hypothetical protein